MKEEFTLESEISLSSPDDIQFESLPGFLIFYANKNAENGKEKFIIDSTTDKSFNFCDFEEQVGKVASSLYKRGFRRGDTLINMSYDMVHLPIIFTGVWHANGQVRACYPEENFETLKRVVKESRAGWIFCEESGAEMCLEVAKEIYWGVEIIVNGKFDGCTSLDYLFDDDGDEIPEIEYDLDRGAIILCTSGTTGPSKGAVHTQRTVIELIKAMSHLGWDEDSPNLLISKGTHITGCIFPLSILYKGRTTIVMPNLKKENAFNAIQDYKCSVIWGFPTYLLQLVNDPDAKNYDFSSLQLGASGGAQVTKQMEDVLKENLPNFKQLLALYGMSECCPITSVLNHSFTSYDDIKLPGLPESSLGKVFPGLSLQIRDLETLEPLGPNQKGEICVNSKAPTLFKRYILNEKATEEAFVNGWFRTGDIGYYDEQEFIFIVDRLKDIFKYAGNHVSPSELEDVIMSHDSVAESVVIGINDPEGLGQIPRAFITLREGNEPGEEIVKEITDYVNSKLADYKQLRGGLYILDDFQNIKGKTGKLTRSLLVDFDPNK